MQFFFQTLVKITSLKCRPLLMTNSWSRSRKLSMALRVIAGGMAATSCRIASFNCSIVPGRRGFKSLSSITAGTWAMLSLKMFENNCVLCAFINKIIFHVPCFVSFLLTFKMWELFLPHYVACTGGDEKCKQGSGTENWKKEATWKF